MPKWQSTVVRHFQVARLGSSGSSVAKLCLSFCGSSAESGDLVEGPRRASVAHHLTPPEHDRRGAKKGL